MPNSIVSSSRREFLKNSTAAAAGALIYGNLAAGAESSARPAVNDQRALVAITMDLEMARNFPHWGDTHWDYEKGNLNEDAKRYAMRAGERVKEKGGRIHYFVVGQVLEQENVDWLKEIVKQGHPVGNHTYDHVYVLAQKIEDVQFRFARCPWLLDGKTPEQAIEENIRMCTLGLQQRIGIKPAGFRTPGGFATGLDGRPDVQQMLLKLGFDWVSCRYPSHPMGETVKNPTSETFDGIMKAQQQAQPFVYPTGLVDVPMSPISDIVSFRTCRWKLSDFLRATQINVEYVIENRMTFDFLCHPSVIGVVDPEFKTIDLICDLVRKAGNRAALVDLTTMARRAKAT